MRVLCELEARMIQNEDDISHDSPNLLYKYSSINDRFLDGLLKGEFWFSSPVHFNDPFDCVSSMVWYVPVRDRELVLDKKSLSTGLASSDVLNKNEQDAAAKYVVEKFINSLNSSGVLCLSSTPYEILMWSHYADSHRGVCIEFERAVSNELGSEACSAVSYGGFDTYNIAAGLDGLKNTIDHVFHRKSEHWAYEKEWRTVYMPTPGNQAYGLKKLNAPIKSIIFGFLTPPEDIEKTRKLLVGNTNIKFYKMWAKTSEQKLVPQEIT